MPRVKRSRNRIQTEYANAQIDLYYGSSHLSTTTHTGNPPFSRYEVMSDSSGRPFVDSDLYHRRLVARSLPNFNGTYRSSTQYPQWSFNQTLTNGYAKFPTNGWDDTWTPNWEILAAQAMANANPNRPTVDVPLFLFELRDLPRLIQQSREIYKVLRLPDTDRDLQYSVRNLLPTLGSTNLAYSFGIRPMVDDLVKLFDFANAMQRRTEYLRKIQSTHRLQRQLGNEKMARRFYGGNPKAYAWASRDFLVIPDDPLTEIQVEYWYTMNVELLDPLPSSEEEMHSLSRDLVLGLYANLDTAWNAIPFSWLIDWFTNFGDLASLTRGRIGYRYRDLNIMCRRTATFNPTFWLNDGITQSGSLILEYEEKRRHVRPIPYALPSFYLPLLSNYQTGILASLAIAGNRSVARR